MPSADKIYIFDQIVAKPGQGKALLDAYMNDYAPIARSLGMTFEFSWVSPALWLADESNTLCIAWSVKGAPAWWGAIAGGRANPAVAAFWAKAAPLIVSRGRSYPADAEALGRLADV